QATINHHFNKPLTQQIFFKINEIGHNFKVINLQY
ncbi:hypothetical protein V12B01_20251, partial [Vibrio splendidus 12B01]